LVGECCTGGEIVDQDNPTQQQGNTYKTLILNGLIVCVS